MPLFLVKRSAAVNYGKKVLAGIVMTAGEDLSGGGADFLQRYSDQLDRETLEGLRSERVAALDRSCWQKVRSLLSDLPTAEEIRRRKGADLLVDLSSEAVTIGEHQDLTAVEHATLEKLLHQLIPWRKGPYRFFGHEVDAEWRSNLKWDRVLKSGVKLEDKIVADIGCSSGYYMCRALAKHPRNILGIDPSEKFYYAFQLIQRFVQAPRMQYELFGVEHMGYFKRVFETVLCMGILYHHRDPLGLLSEIRDSMISGGEILIETQAIPGDEPVCLCPPGRYAKARNVYFLPTAECVAAWLKKSRFVDIEIVSSLKVEPGEQRSTAFAPFQSLEDFLDPEDDSRTLEGFDAPLRVMLTAKAP